MGRIIAIFLISITLVGLASFYAGAMLGNPTSSTGAGSEEIINEAKKRIPPLVVPQKPAGQAVTTYKTVDRVVQVPRTIIENERVKIGGLTMSVSIPKPKTVFENQTVQEQVPTTTIADADPTELAKWEREVKSAQDVYNAKLNAEISKVSREKLLALSKDYAGQFKTLISDVLVPILVALAGLIGALIGLKKAFERKPSNGGEFISRD